MESHPLELYPDRGQVHIALFRNVTNAGELRQRLISQDPTLSCALVDAKVVLSPFHALLAVQRAVHDEQSGKLKSHNINSEIVFDFSPNTNIAQSLRRFGIDETTQHLVVIKLGGNAVEVEKELRGNIQGDLVPLSELDHVRDIKTIQKYYQLGNQENDPAKLMQLVAGAIALKGL
ncbi:kinase binding protein CGI-121-domain-containing protein [Dichotomocladium elegans]|nr:kinase binding protein CGI-121-domain-containing protein [Dichotomocladium elegans]